MAKVMSNKTQLYKYKGNQCSVCGMSVQEMFKRYGTFNRMFELHHVNPKRKGKDYNNLIKQNLSSKQIDEVDKCVLLCRNCHGLVHAQDTQVKVVITINYCNRDMSQELSGWLVTDQLDKSFTFLCEQKLLIEPYIEQCGDADKTVISGLDLQSGEHFLKQVKSLNNGDVYSIWSAERNKLMLRVTNNGEHLKVENNVEFGFIAMDGSELPKGERFWYRNGVILYESGEVQSEGFYTFPLLKSKLP